MKHLLAEVQFAIDGLPCNSETRRDYLERLKKLRRACGCRSGAILLLLGLAFYLIFQILTFEPTVRYLITIVISLPLILIACAALGKVGGLLWARLQLARLRRELLDAHARSRTNANYD